MRTKPPLRLAVVGCGRWGPQHIRVFSSLPGAKVVLAADSDPARLKRVQSLYPWVKCARDFRGPLARGAFDAAVIATPTSTHFELARLCLEAGVHVLCEKPLCMSGVQAESLLGLARKKRRVLMTGHVFLFNAGIVKLKELIGSGELGRIQVLSSVRTNLGPIRSDANVAYDLASHDVAIFNWLLGEAPVSASATGGVFLQPGVHDVVFASLAYPGNRVAHLHCSWLNPKKVRQLTAVGTKKMVAWDDLELNTPLAIYDRGAAPDFAEYGEFLRISTWDEDVRLPKLQLDEPLKAQAQHFLDCARTGRAPTSDGAFGAGVVRTIEAINASLARDGAPVRL